MSKFRRTTKIEAPPPFNPDSPHAIEASVDAAIGFALARGSDMVPSDPTRVEYLRVSSFPYCALKWWLQQVWSRSNHRPMSARGSYFTRVGTTVHEVFQGAISSVSVPGFGDNSLRGFKGLPNNAMLVQDWLCADCNKRHKFTVHPDKCKRCGSTAPMRHEEHTVHFLNKVVGHMDGTLAFPHKTGAPYSNKWYHIPFDYKTASESVLTSGKLPYPGNADQLLSYGAIKHHDGVCVPGVVLIYVRRDNPFQRKAYYIPLDVKAQTKKIKRYEREFLEAEKAMSVKAVMALPTWTDDKFEDRCEYCSNTELCQMRKDGNDEPLRNLVRRTVPIVRELRSVD